MDAHEILADFLAAVEAHEAEHAQEPHQRLSATGHCLRQQYYEIAVGGGTIPTDSLMEMNDGNVHEADVKRWLRAAGYEISREDEVDGRNEGEELSLLDGLVTGHIDGQIGVDTILEVKSMSFLRFVDFIENGLQASHPDYYQQLQGYLLADEKPRGLIVVKAKDSSAVRGEISKRSWKGNRKGPVFIHPAVAVSPARKIAMQVVEFNPDAGALVVRRHEMLRDALESGTPPQREYSKGDWQCRYCAFSRECWGVPA
ncbi:MAG: hypothetical protein AB7Q01_08505 [Gammaproteobacteria bacterium]